MLSKSDYLSGLQCLKFLWILKNDKEKIPEKTDIEKANFEQGYLIEELAKTLFPNIIDLSNFDFKEQIEKTKEAVKKRKPLFQGAFLVDDMYARCDFLIPTGKKWDIIDVKSATEVKDLNIDDLAFQKYIYEKAGLKIRNCIIMHINKDYVRKGEINPKELLIQEGVTGKVEAKIDEIETKAKNMLKVIDGECPDFSVDDLITIEYENFLLDEFYDSLPENNIFDFVRILKKKAIELYKDGIITMNDVPDSYKLNDKQKIQRLLALNGGEHIDKRQIKFFLDNLKYPLYFLDFETINTAIPKFDNSKPYQQIPFQFSLHVQDKPNGDLRHISFLAEGTEDPRPAFLKALKDNLGDKGDILVYNQKFEKMVFKQGAEFFPEFLEWHDKNIVPRIKDLMEVFDKFYYYNPKQKGSVSIKYVLPVLSKLKYDGLEIKKGDRASFEFARVTYGDVPEEERFKVRQALEEYCKLDTFAEVEIVKALMEMMK